MSRRTLPEPPVAEDISLTSITALRNLVAEAAQLGAVFRISGAYVAIDGLERLPAPVRRALERHRTTGRLWDYLGGWWADEPAIAFADKLGVAVRLVEMRADARAAIRQLIIDARRHGHIALDIETAPLPGQGAPRAAVRLKIDGGVHAVQPAPTSRKDRTALDPHRASIALLQLYAGGDTCFLFRREALGLVADSRWLRRQHLVIHNAGFEAAFLQQHAPLPASIPRKPAGRYECSLQASGLLLGVDFNGSGRSLATTAEKLLGLKMPKELATSDWAAAALSPGQIAYAAADSIVTWRLWPLLAEQLRTSGCQAAYALQRAVIPAVVAMELRGLGFDREEHARQSHQWAVELEQARREYQTATGNTPPHTPEQRRDWLRTVLPSHVLAGWPRTDTGLLSTESVHLKRLAQIESARPVLAMLAMEKLLSSFGPALAEQINPVTGRVHCRFGIAATKAGRFSAAHPNLQQLPGRRAPEFRRCIRAAPGHSLISADWNQVELRAAAWISQDYALTELYRRGEDLHAQNAAAIAGVEPEAVTPEQRQAAKAVSFGSLYGIGPRRLVENAFADYGVELTIEEASRALDTFFSRFPQLAQWRADNAQTCQSQGFVRIGAGRLVKAEWEPGGQLSFPQCCNLPIQGICADAMLRAITLVHARLSNSKVRGGLVATVHDELLAEVHENDVPRAAEILQQGMIEAFETTFPGAPTTGVVTAKHGPTWADAK
jgi:DNA polymerase-1